MRDRRHDRRRWRISLRGAFIVGFAGLMTLAVGGVVLFGLRALEDATDQALQSLAVVLVDEKVRILERELDPVLDQAVWIERAVVDGIIDLSNPTQTDAFFSGALAATPDLAAIVFVDRDMIKKTYMRDPAPAVSEDVSKDPVFIDAVSEAKTSKFAFWGPPVVRSPNDPALVNLRLPLFVDNEYLGSLFQVVSIPHLAQQLAVSSSPDLKPFVLYDEHTVLAPPVTDPRVFQSSPEKPLPTLKEIQNSVLAGIWSDPKERFTIGSGPSVVEVAQRDIDGIHYTYIFQNVARYTDKPLTVGAYFETNEVIGIWIERVDHVAIFGGAAFVISVAAAMLVGRIIGRPVLILTQVAEDVGKGELERVDELPKARIREIDNAYVSFNQMITDLRERKLVRSLLGTYVPEVVAEKLIRSGGALEPVAAEATILFTDLAGFTTLSEQMAPGKIVEMLNSYFTDLTEAIEADGGVITQYQGDAILAVFNVPVADPDHATAGIHAALNALTVTENRSFAGQKLRTRIGLATGDIVAGSVGAGDRLTYTVHGDAVNLAARLEQMNKQFGTDILIDEETVRRVDGIQFTEIGRTHVRGKNTTVTIYTIAPQHRSWNAATIAETGPR